MQCPSCQNTDSRVLESRSADSGRTVRRRRECLNCDFRFTTYERVETSPITVLKRNGKREIFSRDKLLTGLTKASEKTSMEINKIEKIADELETQLQQSNTKEITSTEIGDVLLEKLKGLNEVAYIRFASVYKQFHGINDFISTLENLKIKTDRLATIS